jgi:metal-responsive CopG/Arc/MetJ family transcriptional regulator
MKDKKISISLSPEVYGALEKESKKNYGVSRSKIIEVALKKYLKVKCTQGCTPKNLRRRFLLRAKWWRIGK